MEKMLFDIKRRAFTALQDKTTCDQLINAYNSMNNAEKSRFYQYFIIDKLALKDALNYTIFPEESLEWDE